MAAGLLGYNLEEFDFICPREIYYAFKAVADERDRKIKADLVCMRIQTLYLINKGLSRDKMIKDPRALMPFEFDKDYVPEDVHIPTADEWEELDRRYAKKK